jgi:hypothetical protein
MLLAIDAAFCWSRPLKMSFLAKAGLAVDAIRINQITMEQHHGRTFWRKRRRVWSAGVASLANRFFAAAGNPVQVWQHRAIWQQWEMECFRMLNGDAYEIDADGNHSVIAEQLPGKSLSHHLNADSLSETMIAAAACELKRAHQFHSTYFNSRWSHGDPHSGNFIFDEQTGRCRMIDFEVAHLKTMSELERHADDLLVFLQDLCGRITAEKWLPLATHFVRSYHNPAVTAALLPRLAVPGGTARIWWAIRTTGMRTAELKRRILLLRDALDPLT